MVYNNKQKVNYFSLILTITLDIDFVKWSVSPLKESSICLSPLEANVNYEGGCDSIMLLDGHRGFIPSTNYVEPWTIDSRSYFMRICRYFL